ncbi:hypothetical protein DES53_104290 [Roseimicrobium gellanilyticum]|uniref:Uncharacterized protein n=2 Tax=Roseimicrobium gellanilyticum TaxID=748857 RepID=A0A366HMT7_9BACT|nr:hypothetical protein DES53_104290 [Roseimicrobium gellanilyticum]
MDAFNATETYTLRKQPSPVKVAFFGSSQSLWAIIADDVARETGLNPAEVRNLSSEGGTPFDLWNLIRRNEEHLRELRLAVVEVNPFVLRQSLDGDSRVQTDFYQHATFSERMLLKNRANRVGQIAEWLMPVRSVRHSLESVVLNVMDPEPGNPIYPCPEQRTAPASDWHAWHHKSTLAKERLTLSPDAAAKRMVGNWRLSKLQDHSLRQSLDWFVKHRVRVVFHELPVHPEVMKKVREVPEYEEGHAKFVAYIESLKPQPLARLYTPDPADCGLKVEHMADRTHINENGAHLYSRHMAEKLRQFLPELDLVDVGGEDAHVRVQQ